MKRRRNAGESLPVVSTILTTRDRPRFLAIALRCYRHQSYPARELIVVDDGSEYPADEAAVKSAGGRLIRVPPGTYLGTKLNAGIEAASGTFCAKMDDDDWYAPAYVATMLQSIRRLWSAACGPTIAFTMPFIFFDLARWELRRSASNSVPGATLFFPRADWEQIPFRSLPRDEDVWFFMDQVRRGAEMCPVDGSDIYLAVRHASHGTDRGHTWTHQWDGRQLESYLDGLTPDRRPEDVLPRWARSRYREFRREALRAAPTVAARPPAVV